MNDLSQILSIVMSNWVVTNFVCPVVVFYFLPKLDKLLGRLWSPWKARIQRREAKYDRLASILAGNPTLARALVFNTLVSLVMGIGLLVLSLAMAAMVGFSMLMDKVVAIKPRVAGDVYSMLTRLGENLEGVFQVGMASFVLLTPVLLSIIAWKAGTAMELISRAGIFSTKTKLKDQEEA